MIDRQPRVIITSCNSQPSSLLSSPSNSQSSTTCLPATQRRNEAPVIPEELLLLAIKEAEAFLSRLDDVESSKTQLVHNNYYHNYRVTTNYCSCSVLQH